jgi:mycofactocin system glycosyltransferase
VRAVEELERGTATSAAALALGRRLIDAGIAHPRPAWRPATNAVTVVIPVRDRAEKLARCLGALERGTRVLVVDDGSRDPFQIASIAAQHGAEIVRRAVADGPAAARNAALDAVDSEFVAFLDSDCVPARSWLDGLLGHFDDPLVAAVAPRVRPLAAGRIRRRGAVDAYLASRSPLDMGVGESAVASGGRVAYVPSAALVLRRSAAREPFDESLRYGEDVDLVWRLLRAGWRIRYEPSVIVAHDEPRTLRSMLKRRFHYGTSAAALAHRHPQHAAPVVLRPWPALAASLLLAGHPGAAAAVATHRSAVLARHLEKLGLRRSNGAAWFAQATGQSTLAAAQYAATFAGPVAVAAAWRTRRWAGLALLASPALWEWWRRDPSLDPVRWSLLFLSDDAAYGAGVWLGCIRAHTAKPLIPHLSARAAHGRPSATPAARAATRAPDLAEQLPLDHGDGLYAQRQRR